MKKRRCGFGLLALLTSILFLFMACSNGGDDNSSSLDQLNPTPVHAIAPTGTNADTYSLVRVGCGYDIDQSTVTSSSFYASPAIAGEISVNGSYICLTPDAELQVGTEYTVYLTANIRYSSGAAIIPYSWSFTTSETSSGGGFPSYPVDPVDPIGGLTTWFDTDGYIRDIAPSGTPEFVYAVEEQTQALLKISTVTEEIEETISLPISEPYSIAYSDVDDALYIASLGSADITVYDIATETISTIAIPSTEYSWQIEVAPTLRRIYLLTNDTPDKVLYIVNLDTETVITSTAIFGDFFAIEESSEQLYAGEWCSGCSSGINRYSVSGDSLALEQSVADAGQDGSQIAISPDGNHLIYLCMTGNGPASTDTLVYDLDPSDLTIVQGQWNLDDFNFVTHAEFSPDNSRLYVTNGSGGLDDELQILDPSDYSIVDTLGMERSFYTMGMALNSDGSMLSTFTFNHSTGTGNRIYMTDVDSI